MKAIAALLCLATVGCSSMYRPRAGRRVSMIMHDGQVAYVRDGRTIPMGMAGGGLVDAVAGNAEAVAAAETFNNRMTLTWVLLGVALAGVGWLAYRADDHLDNDDPFDGTDGLILGGVFACEIGAIWALISAQPYHYDALNIYNDAVAPY